MKFKVILKKKNNKRSFFTDELDAFAALDTAKKECAMNPNYNGFKPYLILPHEI